jgi:hypothetical protein
MFLDTSKNLKITFKDKKEFNILDLERQISAVIKLTTLAEAITSDDKIDNFMINVPLRRDLHEIEERFGKRIIVKSINHNSPTLLTIIVGYKVADIILRYFDENNPEKVDFKSLEKNRGISRRILADFITALEILKDIIDEIIEE